MLGRYTYSKIKLKAINSPSIHDNISLIIVQDIERILSIEEVSLIILLLKMAPPGRRISSSSTMQLIISLIKTIIQDQGLILVGVDILIPTKNTEAAIQDITSSKVEREYRSKPTFQRPRFSVV